jgi:hypothetical protein
MNRRDFLKRLGLGTAVISLSPMLDLAEIIIPPEPIQEEFVYYMTMTFNMYISNPRYSAIITGITE